MKEAASAQLRTGVPEADDVPKAEEAVQLQKRTGGGRKGGPPLVWRFK